jgi:hypothetical protein
VIDGPEVRLQVREARCVPKQVRDPASTARIEEPLSVAAEVRCADLKLTRRIEHQPRAFQVTEDLVIRSHPCAVSIEMRIHPLNIRVILRLLRQEQRTAARSKPRRSRQILWPIGAASAHELPVTSATAATLSTMVINVRTATRQCTRGTGRFQSRARGVIVE